LMTVLKSSGTIQVINKLSYLSGLYHKDIPVII
jgi:hypothetical protein